MIEIAAGDVKEALFLVLPQVLHPAAHLSVSVASVTRLAMRFTPMDADDLDILLTEFRDYKATPDDQLPPAEASDLDSFWSKMSRISMPGDTTKHRFGKLARFACVLMVLPHANADPERLFSMVGKIETYQRSRLLPSTLRNLIAVKINGIDCTCHDAKFSPVFLQSTRKATTKSLEKEA